MDFTPSLNAKGFFRFTGPPENWLTAIKYMTWGLEEKHRDRWKEIQPGDVFFIHSTSGTTSRFPNAKSGVVGIGVIGSNFTTKEGHLWVEEIEKRINKWPLLVPLSEIYLFSELPPREIWEAPNLTNGIKVKNLIDLLLRNYIPLSNIPRFPQMGSFSRVGDEVVRYILYDKKPLYVYSEFVEDNVFTSKTTKLEKVESVGETLRYAKTLQVFDTVKKRIVKEGKGVYEKDNDLLARVEDVHATILQSLLNIFRAKGYDTLSNEHVDLFAHNGKRSFLIDVKSTENKNFRNQARKGLIQLFEYDYFEIRKFTADNDFSFKDKYKILVPSGIPGDTRYVGFINDLRTGVALVENKTLRAVGVDFGFSKI